MFSGEKNQTLLIVGVGTDIGKTFFVEKICKDFVKMGRNIIAIKPIASGFKDDDKNSDSARILSALNQELTKSNLDKISPWRFEAAISPHFAAKSNLMEINFNEVKDFCLREIARARELNSTLLIESAGGVMTPINFQKTFLDLASELKIPLILVTANYLGSISHTLCAIEAIKSRGLELKKVMVNKDLPTVQGISIVDTIKSLAEVNIDNF